MKLVALLALLAFFVYAHHTEGARLQEHGHQRFDGWFNNLVNSQWGGIGDDIIYEVPSAYGDRTFEMAGRDRPNPREISNALFQGPSGLPSYQNRTALFAYFGQMVAYEVVHATDSQCPLELIRVPVPDNDPDFSTNDGHQQYLPFIRSGYNPQSGKAPNNPRKPVNKVSSWIDGNFLYGNKEVWSNCIRAFAGGQLLRQNVNVSGGYPGLNHIRLPMENYPSPVTQKKTAPEELWMFGDAHAHQNPGLMAIALVWFRYHNYVADRLQRRHPDWKEVKVFHQARRHVVATMQNIIMYEWLPAFLGEKLPDYEGYKNYIQPSIRALFEGAAFRIGHSAIPPGLYLRDSKCNYKKTDHGRALRLCNSYWHSQDLITEHGLEAFIQGMASQISEREDHILVEDLRGKHFGPLHFSRHDLSVLTIMRGRDHGLPDYNSVRRALGLKPVSTFEDINPEMYSKDKQLFKTLRDLYNGSLENIDTFVGGLLEATPAGPGELFRHVIRDQFTRLRDADRYWFENKENGLWTDVEIENIKGIRFKDIIIAATNIERSDIQDDVFRWNLGDPCEQPGQLREEDMEPCTPHRGFDYFAGSEIPYITAFTCLGLIPFVCILIAYIIAKYKQKSFQNAKITLQQEEYTKSPGNYQEIYAEAKKIAAQEWTDPKDTPRPVEILLDQANCSLVLLSHKKQTLRVINFRRMQNVMVWVANDKRRDLLLLHVPREYDLVLKIQTEYERSDFLSALKDVLRSHDTPLHQHESTSKYVHEHAITKRKRQELLAAFFRAVFNEAHSIHEIAHPDDLQIQQCKEVVNCEINRNEFAEALALKPGSMFVTQMFSIIDRDNNGYVSFRELLYAVLLFSKGTCQDKMKLLFMMYDFDKSGSLNREEVAEMIRSLMEMANTSLTPQEVSKLVDQMFVSSGLERRSSLKFSEFTSVISDKMDMLWDVCLDWKGTKICLPKKKESKAPPKSMNREISFKDAAEMQGFTKLGLVLKSFRHYMQNHRQQIVYLIIFFGACILVATERFYYYAVETEQVGLRRLAGYWVSLTRSAAAGMSLTFSLLLLTMCRNIITFLRETPLNLYIPFDSHVAFHKIVAYTALFFAVIHIIGYCFNFYHIATQPVDFLCVFEEVYFRSDFLPKVDWWLFANVTGFTGVLLCVVISIIYIFATQTSRTYIFNAFWITHKFFYVLYVLILLHGASRIIQHPYFPYYFIGPAVLFVLDKMVSLSRKKRHISVITAELLPSDVTYLEFKRPASFEYRSGQWVRLACSDLGKDEYHAFTLTTSPNEENLSVHVRSVGPWTQNLRKVYDPDNLRDRPYPTLYIDGPFGSGHQDWFRYEVSVLVGGGIGVTPYASILKDFVFMNSVNNTYKLKCHKVYFIWVTQSQKHFEWLIDILRQAEDVDRKDVVETHIFITQLFNQFDLRTTMLYICEEHFQKISQRSMFTGLRAKTHFGRPNFQKILAAVHVKHPKVKKVGVFSCGPPGLTKGVHAACYEASKHVKARFEHHFENF